MTVCLECGHMQLFFVGACGDPQVGSGKVLVFSGPELDALEAEIALIQGYFDEIEAARQAEELEQLALKQDAIANLLKEYVPPTSDALPSKHLVQAYSIHGKKWTYVRSDKMRNHWRGYDVDTSLLEARPQGGIRQLGRDALRGAWDKVSQDIANDLGGSGIPPKTTGTILKGEVSGSISDLWKNNFTEWVDAVNSSLTYGTGNSMYDLSAAAQLFRAYAGFNVQLGYDRSDGSYGLSASGNARAVLAEAKADLAGYLPNRDGWHALMEWGNDALMSNGGSSTSSAAQLDFGYFRFKAAIGVDAMVGASVMGTIGIEYTPKPNGEVAGRGTSYNGKGEVAAGAFAGAEASAEVKGGLEWDNPEKRASSGQLGWATVYEVGVQVAGNAGIGAEAHFKLELHPTTGKLYIRAGAQLVIGVGAKGGVTATVGLNTIGDFVMYVYHQLVANDFSVLRFISGAAWEAIKAIAFYLIIKPVGAALNAVGQVLADARDAVAALLGDSQAAEDFARQVKANPQMLTYAPPDVKGMILYKLSETFLDSREEHQEGAVLTVMDSIQTRREWDNVIERVTLTGTKSTRAAGMRRLNWLMDGGSQRTFTQMVRELDSQRYLAPDTPTREYRTRFA